MAYTPPVYNVVNFDDLSTSYTPPLFNAVNFDDGIASAGIPSAEELGRPSISVVPFPADVFAGTTYVRVNQRTNVYAWNEKIDGRITAHKFHDEDDILAQDRLDLLDIFVTYRTYKRAA